MKKAMRNRSTVGPFVAVGVITALALVARPSAAGSTRKKVTCEQLRAEVESATKSVGMPMVLKAGDWGKTPPALRALPPQASFCGSTGTSAAVASPLTGKDFTAYYTPILEKMGCKTVKCEIGEKKTFCRCSVKGGLARIGTEELSEAFMINWMPTSTSPQ
jgi:hypothetical protein